MDIIEWGPKMTSETVEVLSSAFAKNPIHLSAFGSNSIVDKNRIFFRVGLSMFRGNRFVAIDGTKVVGFIHWVESPGCQSSLGQKIRLFPEMLRRIGPRATLRVISWLAAWAKNDSRSPHWHLGPVGVSPEAQGHGVGKLLMNKFCSELDAHSMLGFLETDKVENVDFYKQFGFNLVKEVQVIGTTTFFMARTGPMVKSNG